MSDSTLSRFILTPKDTASLISEKFTPFGVNKISSFLKPHLIPILTSSIETASSPRPRLLIYFNIDILERALAAKWI